MKCVAVGDIFITPDMMREAFERFPDKYKEIECFYFGSKKRKQMRDVVKCIERGGREECELPAGYIEAVEDADILMVHLCPVTERVLEKAKNLKAILCNRGGFENIDVEAATKRGIKVLTNPAHNANAVAEFTIGLIFNELRNISRSYMALKTGEWREKYPNSAKNVELKDLTVGIVGFGNVGQLVCEKLSGFGCRILISTPRIPREFSDNIRWGKVKFVDFDELVASSDIISLHARTKDREVLFGAKEFEIMKPTAYFINTSRSYMVDYKALYTALNEQQIKGAAIDVYEKEPIGKDYPLLTLDNVTLTSHKGGDTWNAYADSPLMMLKELAKLDQNEVPKFWINKDALESK